MFTLAALLDLFLLLLDYMVVCIKCTKSSICISSHIISKSLFLICLNASFSRSRIKYEFYNVAGILCALAVAIHFMQTFIQIAVIHSWGSFIFLFLLFFLSLFLFMHFSIQLSLVICLHCNCVRSSFHANAIILVHDFQQRVQFK